jgi:hypothetical protein
MSTIRATCPTCVRPVDLEPAQLLLIPPDTAGSGTYLFVCPTCDQLAVRPARPVDITLLLGAGVVPAPRTGEPTTPAGPCGHQPHAAPFNCDDLLDFHLLLNTDDWLARLAAIDRPAA